MAVDMAIVERARVRERSSSPGLESDGTVCDIWPRAEPPPHTRSSIRTVCMCVWRVRGEGRGGGGREGGSEGGGTYWMQTLPELKHVQYAMWTKVGVLQ